MIDFEILEEGQGFGVRFSLNGRERYCEWCKADEVIRRHAGSMFTRGELTMSELEELAIIALDKGYLMPLGFDENAKRVKQ